MSSSQHWQLSLALATLMLPLGALAQTASDRLPSSALWVEPPSPRPAPITPAPSEWPFAQWSYAKAYAFNLFPATNDVQLRIIEDGVWSKHVRAETLVDRDRALRVVRLVNSTKGSFENSKCPFPRHAFVFFDGNDKPVGSVDVCFECDDLFAWPDFQISHDAKYGVYEDIDLEQTGEPLGPKGGLWAEFRSALTEYRVLFTELGLPFDWQHGGAHHLDEPRLPRPERP
jgi:hypothetical protein